MLQLRSRLALGRYDEVLTIAKGQSSPDMKAASIAAEFFKKPYTPKYSPPGLNNTIMPWKIAADGSVTNGIA